jgi:hypothetical protein
MEEDKKLVGEIGERYALAKRTKVKRRVASFSIVRGFGDLGKASAMAAELNCGRKKQRYFVVRKDKAGGWRIVDRTMDTDK